MKRLILIVAISLLSMLSAYAQKAVVNELSAADKKALQLPDSLSKTTTGIAHYISANFSTANERLRAAFIWVASTVRYDVENMYTINLYEKPEERISKVLKTRKGTCAGYSALFSDICIKLGISCHIVEGYVKQSGFIDNLPHAWCVVLIDNTWYIIDPTWGAGYITKEKYYPKINNAYYKADPATIISSHMPFDYLWQLLYYPITNDDFKKGKVKQDESKERFNYVDSIKVFEGQSHVDQLAASARRIEKNGVVNSLVFDQLRHIKYELEIDRQNAAIQQYNSAVADFNDGVKDLNDYINYRNNKFRPVKPDAEIQQMLDVPLDKMNKAKLTLAQIQTTDENISRMVKPISQSIDEDVKFIEEQQRWLKTYFGKSKAGRMLMFVDKITWFGVPLK